MHSSLNQLIYCVSIINFIKYYCNYFSCAALCACIEIIEIYVPRNINSLVYKSLLSIYLSLNIIYITSVLCKNVSSHVSPVLDLVFSGLFARLFNHELRLRILDFACYSDSP